MVLMALPLRMCGRTRSAIKGVAMRNATTDARAVADHVTALDNNAAGMGAYLFGML